MGVKGREVSRRTQVLCQGPQTPPDLPPNTDSVTLPEELLLCVCVYLGEWLSL